MHYPNQKLTYHEPRTEPKRNGGGRKTPSKRGFDMELGEKTTQRATKSVYENTPRDRNSLKYYQPFYKTKTMSELKLEGKLHKIFETQEVSSTFKKREFVIVTQGEYPEHVKFELTQAKCDEINNHKVGDEITVHFNIRGREWTSPKDEVKYFVSLNAWRIETHAASNDKIVEDMVTNETETFSSELPF